MPEWISVNERMPGPEECGANGRIIVWHRYNGAMIANTFQLRDNRFMEWWMPYPERPEGAVTLLTEPPEPRL